MALQFTLPPLPIFLPKFPSHRSFPELRFSRWNNANADKFLRREHTQKAIEDDIRRQRRYESASKIADYPESEPPVSAKSVGTPSSPSRPSIPGKRSKYSKKAFEREKNRRNDNSHPAFSRVAKVPIDTDGAVTMGERGVAYRIPNAPFEFQYSYTETPKVKPLALREAPFLPFGPTTMPRPWTGRAPIPPSKKKLPEFDSFKLPPPNKKGVKTVQAPGPFLAGMGPKYAKSRDEILGEPLTEEEIKELVQGCLRTRRQLNMGRDGLTHNMLDNIHAHWKRRRVCKIKCKGVCTVDMENVIQQLEEKTGGKIIYKRGGVLFLYRGRNYNYRTHPRFPLMLWKPITPVYPRLVQQAPEGLTIEESREIRKRGHKLPPICKLGKNGVYSDLVKHVREAFEECELVRIDCQGMNGSDFRKIGAKLKDLVPCILISFAYEHILMWRGRDWKSSFPKSENGSMEVKQSETDSPTARPPSLCDSPVLGDQETSTSLCAQSSSNSITCSELHNLSTSLSSNEQSEATKDISDSENEDPTSNSNSSTVDFYASSALSGSVESNTPGSVDSLAFEDQETSVLCAQNSSSSVVSRTSILGSEGTSSERTKNVFHPSNGDEPSTVIDLYTIGLYESSASSGIIESTIDQSLGTSVDRMGSFHDYSKAISMGSENFLDFVPESDGTVADNEVQASLEGAEHPTELAKSVSTCTEGVMLLWKEAIDNGNAVVLDDASLDANIVYDAAISLAKAAPPGPIFRQRPRKALVQTQNALKQEDRNLDEGVSIPEKKIEKRNSRNQRLNDFKGVYSDTLPHGSLGVDELAKLLA